MHDNGAWLRRGGLHIHKTNNCPLRGCEKNSQATRAGNSRIVAVHIARKRNALDRHHKGRQENDGLGWHRHVDRPLRVCVRVVSSEVRAELIVHIPLENNNRQVRSERQNTLHGPSQEIRLA